MEGCADVTGAILVGGKSARIGWDKAFLPLAGTTFFERTLDVMKAHLETIFLVGDRPKRFARYGLPVYADLFPGSPLGGLYTALSRATTAYVFVSPCDLPFASPDVMGYFLSLREGYDAVVPLSSGHPEPLFAVYSRTCRESMRKMLETGNYRISDLYPRVTVRRIPEAELAPVPGSGKTFRNINTMEDYERLCDEDGE